MHPHLNTAIRAARRAGNIIIRHIDQIDTLKIEDKGLNDLVTSVDHAVEDDVVGTLLHAYPDHCVLGEEGGYQGNRESPYMWIIDPLDGTLNFVHGIPHFAVSIALKHRGHIEQACIYDPISQELFSATKGAGAQLNDRRIRVSDTASLRGALIGASLGERGELEMDAALSSMKSLVNEGVSIRRFGASTLNLAYVAAGRLDAFWDTGLKEWDMAAGSLLIREAGGFVSDLNGQDDFLNTGAIIAGTRRIYTALSKNLNEHGISKP